MGGLTHRVKFESGQTQSINRSMKGSSARFALRLGPRLSLGPFLLLINWISFNLKSFGLDFIFSPC